MPLLFMDNSCEAQCQDSLSAEECSSNTSGLQEREGEERQMGPKVTKRREKNRDAARKSRKKQTERADELHQELQRLEQSNSALRKEIAELQKTQRLYETALERHTPRCRLRSSACPSVSSSAQHEASTSPPQASNATSASQAKSATPSVGPQSLNCTKDSNISPSTCALTTKEEASSPASLARLLASSSSLSSSSSTFPYSVSFSSQAAPHSLFSQLPLPTSRSTHVTPSCASLVSKPAPSAAASLPPGKSLLNKTSSVSQSLYFPKNVFPPASPNQQASLSPVEEKNVRVPEECRLMNPLQLYPYQLNGNLNNSRPSDALFPLPLPDPAPQVLFTSPHVCLEPPHPLAFSLRPSHDQQVSTNSASILSLLTTPSQLNVTQSTSSCVDEPVAQPLPSLLPSATQQDPFRDLSLSEFLESNDWILSGINDE